MKLLVTLGFCCLLALVFGGPLEEFGVAAVAVLCASVLLSAALVLPVWWRWRGRRSRGFELVAELMAVGAALLSAAVAAGASLPVAHEVSTTMQFAEPPARVWIAATAVPPAPTWRPWVYNIHRVRSTDQTKVRWYFWSRRRYYAPETVEYVPLRRVTVRDSLRLRRNLGLLRRYAFTASWTIDLHNADTGTLLTATERAAVNSPMERLIDWFFGYRRNLSSYVAAVERLLTQYKDAEVLIAAINRRDDSIVEGLLTLGADPNARDARGQAPLLRAAQHGTADAVKQLVASSADVAASDRSGYTALIYVILGGRDEKEKLRILVDAGADVNARDRDGRTALMHAASRSPAEIVQLLLAAGADRQLRDSRGRAAIDYARTYGEPNVGRPEIIKLLE